MIPLHLMRGFLLPLMERTRSTDWLHFLLPLAELAGNAIAFGLPLLAAFLYYRTKRPGHAGPWRPRPLPLPWFMKSRAWALSFSFGRPACSWASSAA